MNRIFLSDERIILRPLELSDLEGGYLSWFDDPLVCRGNNHHRFPYSINDMENYINNSFGRDKLVLAIVTKKDNKHVGNISLTGIDAIHSSCSFSIVIGDKNIWGQGIGYAAAKLIVGHAFNELNVHRINIGTFESNLGMRNLALKLGALEEGIRRKAIYKNGQYLDVVEYGLLRHEYKGDS